MENKPGKNAQLSTAWEGPFVVAEVTHPTSYRLAYLDGTSLPNS